ncbi:TetR/AcrR family transcriptional regulator [Luminiphilus syltensis]|uniref:TetR/AcrR family transcriptional regulator n=1 Tax=Luminiphilus syltensis TaxID=1341119 RepID=UPI0003070103|nr:TetR/AcrR family transcriptional regulator [Luminiphilus syltensis]
MKTKDRILDTALALFNENGERNVSANDIALELDISPGNLYYHFKGKDSIISALFTTVQRELVAVLGAPLNDPSLFHDEQTASIERSWLFLTVVFEHMFDHRFIFINMIDLMQRYPEIDRGIRRLLSLQRAACFAVASDLVGGRLRGDKDQRLLSLADAMTMNIVYWLSYEQLRRQAEDRTQTVHRGVLQTLSYCAPYLGSEAQDFYDDCERLYSQMLASDDG